MKIGKKITRAMMLAFFSVLLLSGCSHNVDDETEDDSQSEETETPQILSFNLDGAKALASQDANSMANRSARAAADAEALLVRILEDGSLQSAITLPSNINVTIKQIAVSPAENSHEVYVVFNQDIYYWNEGNNYRIGQLLCVKPDGSYFDILNPSSKNENNNGGNNTNYQLYAQGNKDYLKFDKLGNMYYQVNKWNGNSNTAMIYKFDPKKNTSTPMTPEVDGTYYEDFILSDNGGWIFASAYRSSGNNSSTRYLRAIPTANAEQQVNIAYSSDGNGWFRNLMYDDAKGYLYFTGYFNNKNGIYRIERKNGTFSSSDLKCLANSNGGNFNFSMWNYIDSANGYFNYDDLLQRSNNSTAVAGMREFISSGDDYYILIDNNMFKAEELIKVFLKTLISNTSANGKTFTVSDFPGPNEISVDFKFDKFKTIEGFERLEEMTRGKKNEEALRAINNEEGLSLIYRLYNSNSSSDLARYASSAKINYNYYNNFMADITYKKNTDTLLCNTNDVTFTKVINNKYYSSSGYVDFTYVKEWVTNYTWNSAVLRNGQPDTSSILAKLYSYCVDDQKEFKLTAFKNDARYGSLYSEKKDAEAITFLSTQDKLNLVGKYMNENGGLDFVRKTCFVKGTEKSACKFATNGTCYSWRTSYVDEKTGKLKAEEILESIFACCATGEKEFRLTYFKDNDAYGSLYTEKKNEEAIEFLNDAEKLSLVMNYINSNSNGNELFIKNTCFKVGTYETAYVNRGNEYTTWDYSNCETMAKTDKGIYASVKGNYWNGSSSAQVRAFSKLFDSTGSFVAEEIPNSSSYYATMIKQNGSSLVFKNSLLDSAGQESGKHTIQMFNPETNTFTDLFKNVDSSNNIEIVSYTVGGGFLYFSGVQGLSLVSGKVDISTLAYTPINSTKKMTEIITVK